MSGLRPYLASTCLGAFLLLSACSSPEPVPLPTHEDTGLERECPCVTQGRCWVAELADGEGEERAFECRWEDRTSGRATCTWEHRFKRPNEPWSGWSKSVLQLRHLGEKGWCWDRPPSGVAP